jgi:hypothetical protein
MKDLFEISDEMLKRAYCEGADMEYEIVISTKEGKELLNSWVETFKNKSK